jgi:hypothetical protein
MLNESIKKQFFVGKNEKKIVRRSLTFHLCFLNFYPVNTIIVEIVEDGEAVLVGTTLLQFTIVGLGKSNSAIL